MKRERVPAGGASLAPERLHGLAPAHAARLLRAARHWASGEFAAADQVLLDLSRSAGDHPEVLRWLGMASYRRGGWARAAELLARSLHARPDDPATLLTLAAARDRSGDFAGALQALRSAAACAREAEELLHVSIECDRQGHAEEALAAIEGALRAKPGLPIALLQRARCLQMLGEAARAAADCRSLIARGELAARAWFALLDLKTVRIDGAELTALEDAEGAKAASPDDRVMLQFALGKALEDAGRYEDALATLGRANAGARPTHPWDRRAFSRRAAAMREAFAVDHATASESQGREVIFLVGLPRSSTTLVEQVLAAHSRVEGASELPYLNQVLEEESRRRGRELAQWAAAATAADWTRLGKEYLSSSARWRTRRPIATDKLPENWLLAGAAMAMLPEARVIDCRRDPLETCWSCYKQLFAPGRVGFTYDFESLAAYWHDYERTASALALRHPTRFRVQGYEALVADPEGQIRALLEFCDLPFEPGCLEFHAARRAIRTPSSSQVRQPMRNASTPAAGYGALLDPLRALLAAEKGLSGT